MGLGPEVGGIVGMPLGQKFGPVADQDLRDLGGTCSNGQVERGFVSVVGRSAATLRRVRRR
jgi:hypothetical protein